jgi:DNA-binding LytR/AlgR family response regulator
VPDHRRFEQGFLDRTYGCHGSTQGSDLVITPAACLDINLHDEMIFPVAELLMQRGIPIIFATGYSSSELMPPHLTTVPLIQKPYETEALMALVESAFARIKE